MLRHLDRTEEYLAVALAALLGALLTAQIVLRFVFEMGFAWTEEIARVMFIWVIFLGAVVGMRRHLHFRVTAGLRIFPERLRPAAEMLGDVFLLLFCLALTWHGLELVQSTVDVDFRLRATGISMFWPYLIMPLSFGLQALRLIMRHIAVRRGSGNA
jgi:TRAP-type C4-dicarboxylate transport system permease small subunit